MTKKKIYTAPTAAVFNLYAEQSMLSTSTNVYIGRDDEDTESTPMTNQKGFYEGNLWSNMREGSEYDM